jgi:carbamoyl-phosphate synthase large subunit
MFQEVDPVLGPEMRSTGEVLGLADSFGLAYFKAQEATQTPLPEEGCVLITITDNEKNSIVQTAKQFVRLGFKIKATEGTHLFLKEKGIHTERILKMQEGRPNIVDAIKNGQIQLVINTPIGKQSKHDDSYIGIAASRKGAASVKSLQQYHLDIK